MNCAINKKIDFYYENKNVTPSWFGLPIKILIEEKKYKSNVIKNLEINGIETRPIISGNFANQPAAKKYKLSNKQGFPNTDLVYDNSFFIGLPSKIINNQYLKKIISCFEKSFK